MKVDRLYSILMTLHKKQKATAPELAKRFGVSRRTIGRDLEDLVAAGFPIVTQQGSGGGISFADGYALDHKILSKPKIAALLDGRDDEALPSESESASAPAIEFRSLQSNPGAHAGGTDLQPRGNVRLAQIAQREAQFASHRQSVQQDEPAVSAPNTKKEYAHSMTVLFDRAAEQTLAQQFGRASFKMTKVGKLRFEGGYDDISDAVRWILGFGEQAQVLSPVELLNGVRGALLATLTKYKFLEDRE